MTQLIPNGKQQFEDQNGHPLVGGKVYFYAPGTTTPKDTYQDVDQTILNTNPVILNARGQASIYGTGRYRQILRDAFGSTIWDQVITDEAGDLKAGLSDPNDIAKGDALVAVRATVSGGVARTQHDKNEDTLTVKDTGAKGDGVTNDTAAIQAMIASAGYAVFARGSYVVSTATLDAPLIFEPGASLLVNLGSTLTISGPVTAPKQWIFKGAGDYRFINDANSGEDSRQAHVSWFGAFPGDVNYDNGIPLQKLTTSMGNTREALIQFDIGTYFLQTPVVWQRASKVRGVGDRLTNIWVKFLTGDVFSTAGDGCNFHDLQFNCDDFRTSGAYIALLHTRCETYDIYMDHGFIGIDQRAAECESHRTKGLTWSSAAGSRLIRMAGDDCLVDVYNYTNNTIVGPEYVVGCEIVAGGAARPRALRGIVKSSGGGVGILHTSLGAVNGAKVEDITMIAGGIGVTVRNTGTASPNIVDIDGVTCLSGFGVAGGVLVESTSTGSIFGVNIDNVITQSVTGTGIRIDRQAAGAIRNITIGQHDLSGANGLVVTGLSNVNLPDNLTIGAGNCHNCSGNGYDLSALVISGGTLMARSNTGIGVRIGLGSNHIFLSGVSFGNGTEVSDLSGAVTKAISILN